MATTRKNIRKTDIMCDRVRSVPLGHLGCAALREAGVMSLGIDDRAPGSAWGENLSPTHLLFFIVAGAIEMVDLPAGAGAGQCLYTPASIPKNYRASTEAVRAVYLHFRAPPWPGAGETPQVFSAPGAARLDGICEALLEETPARSVAAESACRRWAELLLIYLKRQLPAAGAEETVLRQRLDAVWQRVGAALAEPWTVARLAILAHMSEGHFHRQVRRLYGQRPMAIVRRLRLERAADLLRTTCRTLDDIAAEVGYATGYALSNACVKVLKQRPRELRKGE